MKKIALAALALVAVTACTEDDLSGLLTSSDIVQFGAKSIAPTRVSADTWEADDKIGITAIDDADNSMMADNVPYITTGGSPITFTAVVDDDKITYPRTSTASFYAYYPYAEGNVDGVYYVNVADQTDPSKIDFLLSDVKSGSEANATQIDFSFAHKLTYVKIGISVKETVTSLDELVITMKGLNSTAQYNIDAASFTNFDNVADVVMELDINATDSTATAIVIPSDTDITLEFKIDDTTTFTTTITEELLSGYCHEFTAVVGYDGVEFSTKSNIGEWGSSDGDELGSTATENGSLGTPYIIDSYEELCQIGVEDSWGLDKHYVLNASITSFDDFTPIGTAETPFTGSFDGAGYDISLSIVAGAEYAALFGSTGSGAVIKNLTGTTTLNFSNDAAGGLLYAGGLVAYDKGANIESCSMSVSFDSTTSDASDLLYVGHIVGYSEWGTITNCVGLNSLSIKNAETSAVYKTTVGGLVGGMINGKIVNSSVTTTSDNLTICTAPVVGGLVGELTSSIVRNCYIAPDVTTRYVYLGSSIGIEGMDIYLGSLVGLVSNSTIDNCYSVIETMTAAPQPNCYVGGVIGGYAVDNESSTITNCYYSNECANEITGDNYATNDGVDGTVGKTEAEMQSTDFITLLNKNAYLFNTDYNDGSGMVCVAWVSGTYPTFNYLASPAFNFSNWIDAGAPTYAGGDGSGNDPYQISTAYELAKLAVDVNEGNSYADTYFELTDNIDLSTNSALWTPILGFSGNLQGNGYTISGLSINGAGDYQALFASNTGVIEYLYLEGSVYTTGDYSAGLVADNEGSLDRCVVNVTVTSSGSYVGGLVGVLNVGGSILNCYSLGDITGASYVGGLVGSVDAGSVKNSYSNATVTGTGNENDVSVVGGLVGYAALDITISGCYASGKLTGTSDTSSFIGGLIGEAGSDANISNCYYHRGSNGVGSSISYAIGNLTSSEAVAGYGDSGFTGGDTVLNLLNTYVEEVSGAYYWTRADNEYPTLDFTTLALNND